MKHYDVLILGGGNAGFAASAKAHAAGLTVAFVESWDFGGTCPNRGCTPKKVLVAAGHALHEIEQAHVHGISTGQTTIDWSALIGRERDMVSFIPEAMTNVAQKRGDVYRGHARFVDAQTVEVDGQQIRGEHIVIATGSTQRTLPITGAEHLITSDEILTETQQPEDVVFIGGGVIAFEFGHVYQRAGTAVTILEVMPSFLPRLEQDAVEVMLEESKRIGIQLHSGVEVKRIEPEGDRFAVFYTIDGKEQKISADRVINGAGRVPNVQDLDLQAGGVEHENGRIAVDEYLRSTSNPHVWVAGDALAHTAQLSPVATYEGGVVGDNIVQGPSVKPDYRVMPTAVFTVPAVASVGLSEAQANEAGLDVAVTVNDMREWFSGQSYAETVAWAKVLVDRDSDQIVGAHLVGHRGEELIHLFALAMSHQITASELKRGLFAFPTFSSDMKNLF